MPKFRKKPVVIEAVKWTGANVQALSEFLAGFDLHVAPPNGEPACGECIARFDYTTPVPSVAIPTLEGTMTASAGDWIIRGIKGELYPCKPDIFEATYEAVEDELDIFETAARARDVK